MSRTITDLADIGLDELNRTAALQTRVDRKYLATPAEVRTFLGALPADSRVLTIAGIREFRYVSVYFDTPGQDSYLASARGRRRRWKIRERDYLDSGMRWLEVKTCRGDRTVKQRLQIDVAERGRWSAGDRHEMHRALSVCGMPSVPLDALAPRLNTSYLRTTLVEPGSGTRVTLDRRLIWTSADDVRAVRLGELTVVETKSAGMAPGRVDHLLWSIGVRPHRFSKFATGLAILEPGLPHNRWHSTIGHLRSRLREGRPETAAATMRSESS